MVHQDVYADSGKIVLFNGPGKKMVLKKFPVRSLQPGEILVRNIYTTICGSDLHTFCGLRSEPYPTVLGHEIVGEIVTISAGHPGVDLRKRKLKTGDRITWSVFASDPDPDSSHAGMPQKGKNIFKYGHAIASASDVFHGGLAEYCILRQYTAILRLDLDMPLSIAATLNCSISTVAGALRIAGDLRGKNVMITGMGHLGITCSAMCRNAGAAWIGAGDISDQRLAKASVFGANKVFQLADTSENMTALFRTQFERKGVDIIFDMSGSPAAMEWGLDVLSVGGTAVWVGAVFKTRKVQVNSESIIRNLHSIRGLHNYNYEDFEYALDFMERNWQHYPFEEAVEKEFTLEQAEEAFAYAVEHKPLRVGIKI